MKEKNVSNKITVLLLLSLCSLTACFEGTEGCLDVNALNYNVAADTQCEDDCCNYPELNVTFSHKVYQGNDTLNFAYQTPYFNSIRQYFAFDQVSYYVSDVQFITDQGIPATVEDILDLAVLENNDTTFFEVSDNFLLSEPDNFRAQSVGTFIYTGSVTALQLTLGLPELVQQTEPVLLTDGHPLAEQNPSMYDEGTDRYLYNRIEFFRDTTDLSIAPEVIQITEVNDRIDLLLPVIGDIPRGFDISIVLEVDYLAWFADVDFAIDSNETIKNKIVGNLAESFRILSINLSQ